MSAATGCVSRSPTSSPASRCRRVPRATRGSTPPRPTGSRCRAGRQWRPSRSARGCCGPPRATPTAATPCSPSASLLTTPPAASSSGTPLARCRRRPTCCPAAAPRRRCARPAGRPTSTPCCCSPLPRGCGGVWRRPRSRSPSARGSTTGGWPPTRVRRGSRRSRDVCWSCARGSSRCGLPRCARAPTSWPAGGAWCTATGSGWPRSGPGRTGAAGAWGARCSTSSWPRAASWGPPRPTSRS